MSLLQDQMHPQAVPKTHHSAVEEEHLIEGLGPASCPLCSGEAGKSSGPLALGRSSESSAAGETRLDDL